MEQLEGIKSVITQFPLWNGQSLEVDRLDAAPERCGLFPLGVQVLRQREDVLGNRAYKLRQTFLLRRAACLGETAAHWLLQLQQWLPEQPVSHLEQVFGKKLRLWAQDGRMVNGKQPGTGIYEAKIYAEYEKE